MPSRTRSRGRAICPPFCDSDPRLRSGFTWSWLNLGLGLSPGGSRDSQVKIQLRIGVRSWVRGRPGAGVSQNLGPSLHPQPSSPTSPLPARSCPLGPWPRATSRGSRHQLGFGSPSAEWVAGAPLLSSPTRSEIKLLIIVHYCWQPQSLARLRATGQTAEG